MEKIDPTAKVHPTALISAGATVGAETEIGPFCIVGPKVVLGKRNVLRSHVVIEGRTEIGDGNHFFQFCSIGSLPQDLKFKGEDSLLRLGDNNRIREYVTIQPGTAGGGMLTQVGDGNLFMVSSHVGHDARVGNNNVFANSCALAGHVSVGSGTIVGGLSAIHQFARLGDLCMLAGGSMVSKDVPPFTIAQGDRARLVGINVIGLQRRGFNRDDVRSLRKAFRALFFTQGTQRERLDRARAEFGSIVCVKEFLDFIDASERGIASLRRDGAAGAGDAD